MCGIFFILSDTIDLEYLKPLSLKSQARGPESTSHVVYKNVFMSFHRLAINGLDPQSNQPFIINGIYLICNGEIYNTDYLWNILNKTKTTNSDCEIIIEMYKTFGIEYTLQKLDGVFAFILYDTNINTIIVARDPFGVRPLFEVNKRITFASEMKQLSPFGIVNQFKPGTYSIINSECRKDIVYFKQSIGNVGTLQEPDYYRYIYSTFEEAVVKRINNTSRRIGCLLSGGLDSSTVCAIANKYVLELTTFSIGLKGSPDILNARIVAEYLKTNHHEVILSEKEFLDAIPEVIRVIESYDTTTVRASVGNYLIAKYISENTDCKVILNGDGADELMGGYLYFKNSPNELEFDYECRRLLNNIHFFDVLRSDRSISANGLEARTPFLDKNFVQSYLSIPSKIRFPGNTVEKILFRNSIFNCNRNLLPYSIIFRKKEAFSDGVSSESKSWYSIIQNAVKNLEFNEKYTTNPPKTKEQEYYRFLFEKKYPNQGNIIPYFWMPKYSNTKDPSARTI